MKESLLKCMKHGQIVDVMYMAKNGEITKRQLKVIRFYGDTFQAFCFLRHTKRTFKVDNVLALIPVITKERAIV